MSQQGLALVLLALFISLLAAGLARFGTLQAVDWLIYDKTIQYDQLPPADDIVIIEIDDKSLAALGRWPWPRKQHAQLLHILQAANAGYVAFDIVFPEADLNDPQSDSLFANALKAYSRVILPIYLESLGQQGQVVESPPYSLFYQHAAALGHVHLYGDEDGVIRSLYLKEGVGRAFWPHLSLALLNAAKVGTPDKSQDSFHPPSSALEYETASDLPGLRRPPGEAYPSLAIVRDYYNLLAMPGKQQGIRHYSYSDVMEGSVPIELLKDKWVFVGATATGLGDRLVTPVGSMNGVELNAWIFQSLRSGHLIAALEGSQLAWLTFALVFLVVFWLGQRSPRLFLVGTLLTVLLMLIANSAGLLFFRVWLAPASALLGVLLFYPLWSWLRAESMLRFLHAEIEQLSQQQARDSDQHKRQNAEVFLSCTGLWDAHAQQPTPKGELASAALMAGFHEANNQGRFWQEQLQQSQDAATLSVSKTAGVEVISRTIARLNTIKENDLRNRRLIEGSLSQLQDAVCMVTLCGDIFFVNERFKLWFQETQTGCSDHHSATHREHPLLKALSRLELVSGKEWPKVIGQLYQQHQQFSEEATFRPVKADVSQADANLAQTETNPDLDDAANQRQILCQAGLVSINAGYLDTLIFTFTDISQLKAAENARTEALSFLSHDLRSPLVSVLAILERYRNQLAHHSGLPAEAVDDIEALVRKNLDYAESFLQLSKADALVEAQFMPCDLHAVLDAALVQAKALATVKAISVSCHRCEQDVWVNGDMSLLERAVNNLVTNAIKFSPEGSSVSLHLDKQQEQALLSVTDQGPGIDEHDQRKVFQRFRRLNQTASETGAGLGLHFVATVARKHKGRILLNSRLNEGATFTLQLRAIQESELFDAS